MAPLPKVLLCGRPDLLRKPGGDTRQILALQRGLGPAARLSLELEPDLRGVDLLHVFNVSRPVEPFLQASAAWRAGLPVVCTPIFQDLREYNRRGRRGLGKLTFRALGGEDGRLEDARALVNLRRAGSAELLRRPRFCAGLLCHALGGPGVSAVSLQRRLLQGSRLVVWNSPLEAAAAHDALDLAPGSVRGAEVPVGVDPEEFSAPDPAPFQRRFGLRDFVLSIGRVEDLKNQLTLIEALAGLPVDLVLLGDENPAHQGYARAVRRAVARRLQTHRIWGLSRTELVSALAAARVHVLASWVETAGLVSLEAALCGCAVVSTDRGYTRAYLGPFAHYCAPDDPAGIRRAVELALQRGPDPRLRDRVLRRYTVQQVDHAMARLYRRVAGGP